MSSPAPRKCSGAKYSAVVSAMPSASKASPGYRNSQRGLKSSRKRRWRQPSRERGLDHQLARELHPPGSQVERPDGVAVKAAQAAMEVADRRAEQQAPYEAEHRVAEIAMQQRHGALADAALEPVAHDQGVAFAQPCNKALQPTEVIAVVRVAHDDITAARGGDASGKRRPITALRDFHYASPGLLRHRA